MNQIPFIILVFQLASHSFAQNPEKPWVEYEKFTHQINLEKFRAGTHDPDGKSEYYFKVYVKASPFKITSSDSISLLEVSDQNNKEKPETAPEEEQEKVKDELVEEVKSELKVALDSLKVLPSESSQIIAKIEGDELRNLVSKAMVAFDIIEARVTIAITIEIWEENKKYGWFGEDQKIRTLMYHPFEMPTVTQAKPKNQELNGRDEKGLYFEISINYSSTAEESTDN